ncbi:hypothetical protein DC498_04985 [Terrimonas sp.]|uniref:hypothetical protein n=1 Tax=Terrimonas sp. TaxID=1914338 RepID=UPI000D51D106|nr:hypothetical protein [Terrimonas sp.]PVD53234.1 hypothetical protein DC498_04985 [Terrimonas sp.]
MKKLLGAAAVIIFVSCSGNTSSDKYIKENAAVTDSADMVMKNDSSKPKDTLYPSTDTTSYRKGAPRPADTAK